MKIEIDYNGAYAVCKVDGKHIIQCDPLTRGQALNMKNWKKKIKKEYGSV